MKKLFWTIFVLTLFVNIPCAQAQAQGYKNFGGNNWGAPGYINNYAALGYEIDAPGSNIASTITANLVFYANHSSTATQVSGLTYTNGNSTTFNTGIVGNASYHVRATMHYLQVADADVVSLGDRDWTLQYWVRFDNITNVQTTLAKRNSTTATTQEFTSNFNTASGGVIQFNIWNSGTTLQTLNSSQTISATTWYHVLVWHDNTANKIYMQVNGGTITELTLTLVPYDGGNDFQIGAQQTTHTLALDGRIDEVAIWQRVLTADERAYLYNSGSGRTYSSSLIQ